MIISKIQRSLAALIPLCLIVTASLEALPEEGKAVEGRAIFIRDGQSLSIETSEKAIIHYPSFNIGEAESVRFIQPSEKSIVLNRVTGSDESQILGNLSANGSLFFVNPNGIYFGPQAKVNVGSFVASTLDILDEDFLKEKFQFNLNARAKGSIHNEGQIIAHPEGFIALLAPVIKNSGSITARAGRILLGAAERITLDFSGDGLIQFSLEGELEKALVENYGQIEAAHGQVALSLRAANKAIKMVVNADGIAPADGIEEVGGVIRLVCKSHITASQVSIEGGEGSKVVVEGHIDASASDSLGGSVRILGRHIELSNADIDVSGDYGGGTVLIGGDYQGKGDVSTAEYTLVNPKSKIYADARLLGDGGKVIVWSDDTTLFDGKIFARGGSEGGNGGFVETSGKGQLGIKEGFVNTSASRGQFGDWLLDPASVNIITGGTATLTQVTTSCGANNAFTVDPSTIANSLSNVAICAQNTTSSSITVTNAVTMANAGVSLTFTAGSTSIGNINLNNNLTTKGAGITFTGRVVVGANVTLDTTNGGANPTGGNISFSNTVNGSGARTLSLNSGTNGTITMSNTVGATTALTSLTATAATITQGSTVRTTGAINYTAGSVITLNGNITTTTNGAVTLSGPVAFSAARSIDTTNGGLSTGGNITFGTTLNGAATFTVRAGTGTVTFTGAVGNTNALTGITFTSAGLIQIGGNITLTGVSALSFPSPVSLIGDSTITNTANITFSNTLNGAQALTTLGTGGTTTFTGAVGGTTPLTSLSATAATVTQSSTAKTTGALSYSGSTNTNVNGNITTSGGTITFTGNVTIAGSPILDTTNGGATPAGANVSFSSALNGATALTLVGGTGGTITFSGAVGNFSSLTSLSFSSANLIKVGGNITVTGPNPLAFPSPVSLTGNSTITSNNANVSFASTINGGQTLTIAGGTGTTTFTGAVGGTTPLSSLSATAATAINVGGNITTNGGVITLSGPVTISGAPTIDSTNAGGTTAGANISFSNTLNGGTSLILTGGTGGIITFSGAVGGGTALSSLSANAATISQNSTVRTTGNVSYTGSTAVSIAGNITTTSNGAISMTGPVNLSNSPTLDTTNVGGSSGANITFSGTIDSLTSSLTLRSGTGTVTFNGAVGGTNALANLSFTSAALIQIQSNISVTGTNPLTFPSPVSITGTSNITTNNADLTFGSTLNGAQALTLTAGTLGNITFTGIVGGTAPLTSLTIASANNVVNNAALTAVALTQSAGSGTTTFNSPVNTTGASGISLTGKNFTINANVTTTNLGPLSITHSGALTIASGVTLNVDGDFTDAGSGTTSFSGNITSNGHNITFATPITLGADIALNTGNSTGNILFTSASTIDGAHNLTLTAGGGNITFVAAVGGTTRLGAVTINSANNVTANALTLASFTQVAGTGITALNGAVNLDNLSGLTFSGTNFYINNTLSTANAGPVNITVTGTLTLTSSAALSLAGAFTQNGSGGVQSAGSITTTNQTIEFDSPVVLTGTTTLNSGAGAGNILFSSTLDGAGDLALTAGTGNITFSTNVGALARLGNLTINSATAITALGVKAASISQVAASGTSSYTGEINTNLVAGVQLTGNIFSINGNLITAAAGPFTITNSGLLTLTAGASTSLTGAFTQNGAGAVTLSGTIVTSNANISFLRAITLAGATSLNSGTGAGAITLSSTVEGTLAGAQTLTLNSGADNITLSGALGGSVRLSDVTISQAAAVSTQGIRATTLTQTLGSATTTFNGPLDISGASGINLTGTAFTFGSTVSVSSGPLLVTNNTGALTFNTGATTTVAGAFTQLGSGSVSLASSITAGGAIAIASPTSIAGTATLSTAAASQTITLSSTVDSTVNGGNSLTLAAGGGSITIGDSVGSPTTRLGTLTFSSANNISTQSITAGTIVQSAGTGTTTFGGSTLDVTSGGINLTLTNFSRNGAIVTTSGGSVIIANSGTVTLVSPGTTSISGSFQQNGGAGSVNFSGTLTTTNQNITFTSPITLTGTSTFSTGAGAGNISLSTVTGAQALTLLAGTGSITTGTIGAVALTSVTFTSAANITTGAISAGSITQTAGTGTTSFGGALSTTTASGISLTGASFQLTNGVTTTAAGPFTMTNSGSSTIGPGVTFTIDGAFTQSGGGGLSLGANITTANGVISFGSAVTLNGATVLNSSAGNRNITFSSTLNGGQTLSMSAGSGAIALNGTIGGATALTSLTVTSASNITLANIGTALTAGITGATSLTATTNLNFSGTNYNVNSTTLSGTTANLNGGALTTFKTNGSAINFATTTVQLSSGTDLTITTGGGNITLPTLRAVAGNLRSVTLSASSGAIQVAQIGSSNNSEFASLSLSGGNLLIRGDLFTNAISFASSGQMFLGGNITTVNGAVTFPVAVVRDTVTTATVTTAGGNISFASTINGDVALTRNLTLVAGSGNITLSGAVGGTTALRALTITSATTSNLSDLTLGLLVQASGTTTNFNGPISASNLLGIDLTGGAFTFNGSVTTSAGDLRINNSGLLSMPAAASCTINASLLQTGSGAVRLGNTITAGGGVSFNGAVSLTATTSVSTAATNQTISFASTINSLSSTPFDLTLDAGTGNITVSGDIGTTFSLGSFHVVNAQNLTLQALTATAAILTGGTGTTTLNGDANIGSGGINATGNNFVANGDVITSNGGGITLNNSGTATGLPNKITLCDGDYNQIGSGPFFAGGLTTVHGNLLISSPMTIFADSSFDLSTGGGTMTFQSAIDGGFALSLLSSGGTITLDGAIGSGTPIGALTINGSGSVTTKGIQATSISQTASTGTTTFNGALITSDSGGISIATQNITRGGAITTSGGGGLTITNSGTFTSTAAGAITLAGAFNQNGSGSVSFGGTITTTNAAITFASPITLAANTSFNTGTGATGAITLSQSVQGAFSLTLNSGAADTTIGGSVGTLLTPLTAFTIARAANASTKAVSAAVVSQVAGTGTTTFDGTLTATGASGISLAGTSFTFTGAISTTLSGPLAITHTGTTIFASGSTGTISGALTQSGAGTIRLARTLTVGGAVQFNGPFTVSGTGTINTSAANQSITFFNTVDGTLSDPSNLTLLSGTGDILLSASAGFSIPLGSFTVASVRNFTSQRIIASTWTQSAGTGTTSINGVVATSGSGGINLSGNAFTFLQSITTTGSGPVTINNSGTLTTTTGKTISSNGIFTQNGSGSVLLGCNVTTTNPVAANAAINFTGTSAITLIADTTINSSLSGGTITFGATSPVDGNRAITFVAGATGDLIISGEFGTNTRLGAFTISSANNVTVNKITANSITQSAGEGLSTLSGSLDTDSPAGMIFIGNEFLVDVAATNITATNGGSFTVTNQGLIMGAGPTVTSVDGAFIQNGPGPIALGGPLTANEGIFISGPAIIGGDAFLTTSAGSGDISFSNTVDGYLGTENLTLTAGAGHITFGDAVGAGTSLGLLTIQSGSSLTASSLNLGSFVTGTPLTAAAIINGTITANGDIDLAGTAFTFNDDVTTSNGSGGIISIANSAVLTIADGIAFTADGAFTQSDTGGVLFGGSITTSNDAITFAAPITLTAPASLNSGAGVGNITLNGTLNGATTLSLTAGTGNVNIQGVIGLTTPLTALTIVSAADILLNTDGNLSGAVTTTATGTTTLNGALSAGSIGLSGVDIFINDEQATTSGAIAITNSGTLAIAAASPLTASTNFTQTGVGSVSLGSSITTAGILSFASDITLTDHIALDSGGGDLTLSGDVAGAFNLSLTAGAGDIDLSGTVGGPGAHIGNFTITSAYDVSIQGIYATSITQQSGSNTSTLHGNLDTNGMAGISLTGNKFTSSGTVTTANGGPFTLTNSGLATGTGASTIIVDGAFTQNGTGRVNSGGTITTNNGAISHSGPVYVLLPATFTSNGGDITFINTVDGSACLTLVASTGDIQFNAAVGGNVPLGCLTASGATITHGSLISNGAVQETGTAAIQIGGDITTNASDITLTGSTVITSSATFSTGVAAGNIVVTGTLNGNIAGRNLTLQAGSGNITISNAIGGITSFNNLTFSGDTISVANIGSGIVGATGTISMTAVTDIDFTGTTYKANGQSYTAGSNFNFNAGLATSMTSNAQPVTFTTGVISLSNNFSLDSNGGTITMENLLGTGFDFTVDADIGTYNFTQIGDVGQLLDNVTITADTINPTPVLNTNVYANNLVVNSSSPLILNTNQLTGNVTYSTPILIQGDITFSCGGAGTVIFNKTVDAFTPNVDTLIFDFDPCTGSVVFNGPVGSTAPLASLSINAPDDVTINSTMNVGSFSVTNGTNSATITSGLTSTTAGGISLTIPSIDLAGAISTASSGPLVLDNSGTLTVTAGTTFDISGNFQQIGAGDVIIGGSVITHDASIQFTGPVTLTGDMTFNSNDLVGGNISFGSTIQGAKNLTIAAGGQDILFSGDVGTLATPLLALQITTARNVTASGAIYATSIRQLAGTGTTSLSALNTTGANGVQLTSSVITLAGNVSTAGSGPLILNNAGLLTLGNATYSIGGVLTQSGAGNVSMAGSFTTGGAISFARAVTLTNTTNLDSSTNGQNIAFNSTVTNDNLGAHNLTLKAGTGNITVTGAIGATPIGALTFTSATNVTTAAIAATSIAQSAGSGTTTISGNMTTSGASGINLAGTNFTINGTVTTSGTGPFTIVNSGPLSLTLGSSTSIAGAFSQSGGGAVTLSGTLLTANQNITFTNNITLAGNSTLSSGPVAGTITLSGTVNGNRSLSLTAGTGDISFGASLGGSVPLGAFSVVSVKDVTYPLVNAASFTQSASSGATTITGPLSITGAVSVSGGVINQNGAITTTTGTVSFVNSGTLTVGVGVNTTAVGGYSQSGGGLVSLGGSITASNNPISFTNAVNLTAGVTINAGTVATNGAAISFGGAITGGQSLTLRARQGSITLSGNAGTVGTPLTGFTILDAESVSTKNITSTFISQVAGTGTTTFDGDLSTTALSGISLIGNSFTFKKTVTTAAAGPLTISLTGTAIFEAAATGSIAGAMTQSGTGTTQLSSTLVVGGAVQFNGPFTVSGSGALNTSAANQSISFFNTIGGSGDLTLSSGTGDILFSTSASLGSLTVSTVRNFTAQAITASSWTQSAGSGTTLLNGAVATSGGGGINLTGNVFTFLQNVTTTGGGPITITNSGALTTTFGRAISSNGIFTQNGSGAVSLASNITTTNATAANAHINFSGTSPITLSSSSTLDTSIGGGTINFSASSTVNGHRNLTLIAGTGDINVLGDFGTVTRLANFTITSAHDVQLQVVSANGITQLAGTGTTSLLGSVDTDTPTGMTFIGNNFTTGLLASAITTTNGGSVTLTNQGIASGQAPVVVTVDGSYIQNGTGIIFVGGVTARQGISFTGPAILAASGTMDTSAGNGDITFSNIVVGLAGTEDLIINAGMGNATFSAAIGDQTMVGPFPVTAIGSLDVTADTITLADVGTSLAKGINGDLTLTTSAEINFTGTVYHTGAQTYNATTEFDFNLKAGALTTLLSDGADISFNDGLDLILSTGTDLTITTGNGNLILENVTAQTGDLRSLILDAGTGSIEMLDLGIAGESQFALASFTGTDLTLGHLYADSFTFDYSGTLFANGDIVSTDTSLSFPGPVILDASTIFSTVALSGATIAFSGTVDGSADDTFSLTLNTGGGNIDFAQHVGMTHRLANITINSATDVTLAAPATMMVDSLFQFTGFGTTTFNGALVVPTAIGISLSGTHFTFNNAVQTFSNGGLSVTNSGLLTFAGLANLSGAFTQMGSGTVALSGSIVAGQPILFTGATTLSGNPSLDTSAANQPITFQGTINGSGNLTFAAGTGDILLQSAAGQSSRLGIVTVTSCQNVTIQSLRAAEIDLISSTGTATVNGALDTEGPMSFVGHNFILNGSLVTTNGGSVVVTNSGLVTGFAISSRTIDGSYTQNGTGPVNYAGSLTTNGPISFSSPVTLLATSIFNSSAGNGNITFQDTVEGPGSFTLSAGGGDILLNEDIGTSQPLGAITIGSAHDVQMQIVLASSLTQSAGTGKTTFNKNISTSGSLGINLIGTDFERGANWTTGGSGPMTVNNSGTFTSTAPGTIISAGAFTQSGLGSVLISGSLATSNAAISFNGPITLADNMSFNSGPGAGSITFNDSIEGAADATQTLTLTSGTGNITFQSGVGSTNSLSTVTIASAQNVTFNGLKTTALLQATGTGTTTLNNTTLISTIDGIEIGTNAITLNGNITTGSNGPITLTNSDLLTITATCSVAGDFTQNGLGSSLLSGSITSDGAIFFTRGLAVSGSAGLTTSSQLITLSSTLDGPGNLTIDAGTANIIFGDAAGATRLGTLTFVNAGDITTNSIQASAIIQTAGSGITTISGDLNTNGSGGIHLTGTTFDLNGSVITSGGGIVVIDHTADSSLAFGSSTLLGGAFTEMGSGTITLSGPLHASDADITFNNPLLLTAATSLNSDGAGDITISSAVDGAQDLVLTAGTGTITIDADIGSTTPITSLTIVSAANVTTKAISADYIVQEAGSGLTTFNGALTTTALGGIDLSGTAFSFTAPVQTLGNGPVSITNSDLLTIATGASFTLTGSFSQLGLGAVALSDNLDVPGNVILFNGAVTLGNDVLLDTGSGFGDITFSRAITGLYNLSLNTGSGEITFMQDVGPIDALQVDSASTVIAEAIDATSITMTAIATDATFNGPLSTSGVGGITLNGAAFHILEDITTTGAGPFTVTNTDAVTFASDFNHSFDGPFLQNGTGRVYGGGTLHANDQTVEFQAPFILTGNVTMDSGLIGGDITLREMEGAYNAILSSGGADVILQQVVGDETPLHNFTITAQNIYLNGIGSTEAGVTGTLSLTATNNIVLTNTFYSATAQTYTAGNEIQFNSGVQMHVFSFGGDINFTNGQIHLDISSDLHVVTNDGNFSFVNLLGTSFENIIINTGTGRADLNTIASLGTINNVIVDAGRITISGPIDPVNTNFVSLTDIVNTGAPMLIQCGNTPHFNALGGNVGTLSSPLFVQSANLIFAGANKNVASLADFNGSSFDNTVHPIPSNPPCKIIFNGIVIKDCTIPPSPNPSPNNNTGLLGVPMPGFESSWFNLASDYYFFPYLFDKRFLIRDIPLYQIPSAPKPTPKKETVALPFGSTLDGLM